MRLVGLATGCPASHPWFSSVGGARLEFHEFWNDSFEVVASLWYWKDAMYQARPSDSNVRHEGVILCKSAYRVPTPLDFRFSQHLAKHSSTAITEMSCVDFMYQFYSPYFSYKTPTEDTQVSGIGRRKDSPRNGHGES